MKDQYKTKKQLIEDLEVLRNQFVELREGETKRKRAEVALRESQERFKIAAQSGNDLIWEWDIPTGRLQWLGAIDELLGYAPGKFPRTIEAWEKVIHPDDHDRVMATLDQHLKGQRPYDEEYRVRRKDGTYRYWIDRGTVLRDSQGNPLKMVGACADITERKRAEEALRENEKRMKSIFRAAPIGIGVVTNRVLMDVNTRICEMTGYSREELIGSSARIVYPTQGDFDYVGTEKYRQIAEKGTGSVETRWMKKDGTIIDVLLSSTPIDPSDLSRGVTFTALDITERKRAEGALQESEERFRLAFENANTGMCLVDLDGNLTRVNNKMCEIFGYTKQELERMTVNDIAHPEDIDKSPEFIQETLQGKIDRGTFEKRYFHKKGHVVTCQVSSSLVRNADGLPLYFISHVHDITERKRAEGALRESEERYRTLVETSPDAITLLDLNLNIVMVNPPALALYGYESPEEVVGRSALNFITPEDQPRALEEARKMLETGSIANAEFTLLRKEDVAFPAELRASLILDGEKRPFAIICVTRDISARKRGEEEKAVLEDQLRQSQKMEAIGRLAGGVAHDFNNLLTVIKGYCQLSLVEIKEGNPLREALEVINKATEKAADLTRQLLAFSRRQIMEVRVLDVNGLLQNLDKMLRRIIGEDIELVTLLGKDLGRVKADPGQIEQVVMNLAVNAKDAMSKGGKLIIETANVGLDEAYARAHVAVTPGRYVMIAVGDTGAGMAPEVKDRVFEPFFTTKEKGKGTGLGLSTVYGIVKQSNGNIWVYSEPGKGTTFKIFLPRVDEPAEKLKGQAVGEELPPGTETILVVEDDKEVRNLAVRILKRQGYTVLDGSYGDEALNVCRQHRGPIHLLVTDVVMPGMSGHELAKRLESIHPEMKVLYMSGYTDNAIVLHGVLVEGVNYIQKPFTVDALTKKVREVLEQ